MGVQGQEGGHTGGDASQTKEWEGIPGSGAKDNEESRERKQ